MSAPPLGKYLASTEKKIRDKAINNLSIFLADEASDALTKPAMDKLWKGIFYGFWMSDKPLVQQALATELADLVLVITNTSNSLAFLRGFWEMILREWNGIDRLRIDKYYMLVRRFINASFRLLIRSEWDKNVCSEYNAILCGLDGPLCPSNSKIPASLTYHLADIYVQELDKALHITKSSTPPPLPAPLYTLLKPFLLLAAQTPSALTYKRVQSALLDPLLSALLTSSHGCDGQPTQKRARLTEPAHEVAPEVDTYLDLVSNSCYEDPRTEGKVDGSALQMRLLRSFFEMASQPETRDSNRKRIYALWIQASADDLEGDR